MENGNALIENAGGKNGELVEDEIERAPRLEVATSFYGTMIRWLPGELERLNSDHEHSDSDHCGEG